MISNRSIRRRTSWIPNRISQTCPRRASGLRRPRVTARPPRASPLRLYAPRPGCALRPKNAFPVDRARRTRAAGGADQPATRPSAARPTPRASITRAERTAPAGARRLSARPTASAARRTRPTERLGTRMTWNPRARIGPARLQTKRPLDSPRPAPLSRFYKTPRAAAEPPRAPRDAPSGARATGRWRRATPSRARNTRGPRGTERSACRPRLKPRRPLRVQARAPSKRHPPRRRSPSPAMMNRVRSSWVRRLGPRPSPDARVPRPGPGFGTAVRPRR